MLYRNGTAYTDDSRGFTLVELLVVIGIIAVLISILLPSLSKARQAALSVACQSQVRQLVMAAQMYANENDGILPAYNLSNWTGSTVWWQTLAKYVAPSGFDAADATKNKVALYQCPSASPDLWQSTDAYPFWWNQFPVTYQISYYASDAQAYVLPTSNHGIGGPHWNYWQYTKITNWVASSFILFGDSLPQTFTTPVGKAYSPYLGMANGYNNFAKSVGFYHGPGGYVYAARKSPMRASAGFLDGHVESLSAEEFIGYHLSPENAARCYGWNPSATTGKVSILDAYPYP